MNSDNVLLVAPRPVRLTSGVSPSFSPVLSTKSSAAAFKVLSAAPTDAFKLAEDDNKDNPPVSCPNSPRTSPRTSLPSEALEEFLSILKPASLIRPPTSPVLRATVRRNNGPVAMIPYERSHPYKRDRSENTKPSDTPSPVRNQVCVTPFKAWSPEGNSELASDSLDQGPGPVWYPFEWHNYDVSNSPVNRALARNPFHRQALCDPDMAALSHITTISASHSFSSPSPHQALTPSFSPATIPLPSPGPNEFMELDAMS